MYEDNLFVIQINEYQLSNKRDRVIKFWLEWQSNIHSWFWSKNKIKNWQFFILKEW